MAARLGQPGTPGCPPRWPPATAKDTSGTPRRWQPPATVLGPRLELVPGPGPALPDRRVVLAKPFIPPENSSLSCTRSPCPTQGLLLSPNPVPCGDGDGWRDGDHLAARSPISAKPLRGVRGVPTLRGGLPSPALAISQPLPPPQGTSTAPGRLSARGSDTEPGFAALRGPGGSRRP